MENGTNEHSDDDDDYYFEKRFDCYEIDWLVENFCVATCGDGWVIESPEFTIKGFYSTTWLMNLCCEKCNSGDILRLSLKRSSTDAGPETVWVDWRCTILGHSKVFGLDSLMHPYDKGVTFCTNLGSVEDVIKKFSMFESDCLTVRSNLIFYGSEDYILFEPCGDSKLKGLLSDNLLELLREKKYYDLKLKVEDEDKGTRTIAVHKAVVCSRIKELNYLLETSGTRAVDEEGECDMLDFSGLNFDAMIKILKYTYSGNLRYVFQSPTFDICDWVNKLQISELKPFFIPNKLFFRTSVDCHEFSFTWIIPDVRDLMLKRESISSPLFTDGCSDKVFQIHFAPKEESYSDFYGLHILAKGCVGRLNACIECAITNENNSCFFFKRSRVSTENTETYGINKYLGRNMAKYFADEKCQRILVRLCLSNGLTSSRTEKHSVTFTDYMTSDQSFELLSNSILAVYETAFLCDCQILVHGTTFHLHKSILAARCGKLYCYASLQDKEKIEETFAGHEPRIFNMILKYVYSGVVYNNENDADVTEIYDLAAKLRLMFLKAVCSTFMQALIQYNRGVRDKVSKVAMKHKDTVLLKALEECTSDQEDLEYIGDSESTESADEIEEIEEIEEISSIRKKLKKN